MDDEVLVRVLDGGADVEEQPQPRVDPEPVRVAVGGDRLTVDVLHHEVRQLAVGHAAVEELRDVRMAQRREDLPLGDESPLDLPVVEAAADDFDRHPAAELPVVTLREVDDAHAAASELAQDLVRPDVAGRVGIVEWSIAGEQRCRERGQRTLERAGGTVVCREQFAHRGEEIAVTATGGRQPRGAMLRRLIEGRLEEIFDLLPPVAAHDGVSG